MNVERIKHSNLRRFYRRAPGASSGEGTLPAVLQLAVARFLETDIASVVTALAAVVTMTAAVVALRYARRELSTTRDNARIDLTFRLYEHQLNPEFAKHIAITADFITIDQQGPERELVAARRWRRWKRLDRDRQTQIALYLNHLEVVGALYELGRLDRKSAIRLFGAAADEYWKRAEWFVERVRASEPCTFDKWEALARAHRGQGD